MSLEELIVKELEESSRVKEAMARDPSLVATIARVAKAIAEALKRGNKLVIFGNGGSAADSQHIACELVGRFRAERRGLPALSLATNTSCLTAIGNDYGFDVVFARQVEAVVRGGDVVIGISTSGRSRNVIEGVRAAKAMGALTVGLTGSAGDPLCAEVDICIKVPSTDTQRIQEAHITIGHIIVGAVERELFGGGG